MMDSPRRLVVMLGGNFPETLQAFEQSKRLINSDIGKIIIQSSLYETEPWLPDHPRVAHAGSANRSPFLNVAMIAVTYLNPSDVMRTLQKIEIQLGRVPNGPNGPRLIDIDLLFYEQLVMQSAVLTIPHPRLHLRKFNLIPLNEIMPWFRHPVFNKTIHQLLAECGDELGVEKIS